jgi:hypothetical protein
MCFINPKHEAHFVLKVCTAFPITQKEFERLIKKNLGELLRMELFLNTTGNLRWCLEDYKIIKSYDQKTNKTTKG